MHVTRRRRCPPARGHVRQPVASPLCDGLCSVPARQPQPHSRPGQSRGHVCRPHIRPISRALFGPSTTPALPSSSALVVASAPAPVPALGPGAPWAAEHNSLQPPPLPSHHIDESLLCSRRRQRPSGFLFPALHGPHLETVCFSRPASSCCCSDGPRPPPTTSCVHDALSRRHCGPS